MEFEGQIIKVLPKRSGTSERTGNTWETQGFVFEYKEYDTDPWHDRVYLETFDTNIMANLVEGVVAKIGFRHKTEEYNGRTYNRVQMNSFALVGKPMEAQQPAPQADGGTGAQPSAQAPQTGQSPAPQPQGSGDANQGGKKDDLPF